MKIAIHYNEEFAKHWIAYCKEKNIPYKIVNCYDNDIVEQLTDCDALMWHFYHASPKDFLFAKQLLYSLQTSGKKVFPDFNTMWHFDDKLGQKYLLESINAPFVPTSVFYDKTEAMEWAKNTVYPKVFKLRGGAGSANVKLVKSVAKAKKLIKKAFGKGFCQYNSAGILQERYKKYRQGKDTLWGVAKAVIRLIYKTKFAKVHGNEKGYVLFQDFIPGNHYDIRIIVIGEKAFGIKRMVRKNDFRASGSGNIVYDKSAIDENCVKIAFELNKKLKSQSLAIDYVFNKKQPLIVEISYGFVPQGYFPCEGYWDKNSIWHEGYFNPYGWMVDNIIK
jgi:glutathione synthase/RimK-type ligase-like ATP-grasp enzyme